MPNLDAPDEWAAPIVAPFTDITTVTHASLEWVLYPMFPLGRVMQTFGSLK